MEALLDFSRPFDVRLFETTVSTFYNPTNPNHQQAHAIIVALRENVQAWRHVKQILEESQDIQAKFIALQILEDTIKYRWKALPDDERTGVRLYVINQLIALSRDSETLAREKLFVGRLNLILVQILKHEWPHNWPSFITELVGAAKTSQSLCENNMLILQLLSEEVFDFSKEAMTSAKTRVMKETLNGEFTKIFELCQLVLDAGRDPGLITVTLRTILRFLRWIPIGFIFETNLIDVLLKKFFPFQAFRNDALACLTEIGSLVEDTERYQAKLVLLHNEVVGKLLDGMLPFNVDIAQEYSRTSREEDREFVHHLSLFFSGFYEYHLKLLESDPQSGPFLEKGMEYLIKISEVDNPEIFKICLDHWNRFASDLYRTECASSALIVQQGGYNNRGAFGHYGTNGNGNPSNDDDPEDDDDDDGPRLAKYPPRIIPSVPSARRQMYARILSQLRYLMISRMTKPEEVLVKIDEHGEVVRETTKDTDAIALYKEMRDTLVYLTHLDVDDTESIMLQKLSTQSEDQRVAEFDARAINTLSWAIGSISGTMDENTEKQFLVAVIKDLLVLCEIKSGKDNKALIASDIMYVVGQYPRFLRNHWKFLKTVVAKLFEFMHELHPGVQDMACDTFLKLTLKCKRKFVTVQEPNQPPFIENLLDNLPSITSDLEPHHIHSFFESVGVILASHPDANQRAQWLGRLMAGQNRQWSNILEAARSNVDILVDEMRLRDLSKIIRTNVHVAKATGHTYITQLAIIHNDMLQLYRLYANKINEAVRLHGVLVIRTRQIKAMRAAKVEILTLLRTFIEKSEDPALIASQVVETLYSPILEDYAEADPSARDAEVLELFASVIGKLKGHMAAGIPRVLQYTFAPTLLMICTNFEDAPEHRQHFYSLLKNINLFCFPALWSAPPEAQKQIVDAIIWGMKHTQSDVAETSLEILEQLLTNVVNSPAIAQQFYRAYLLKITSEVLYCLTDRLHKAGFKMQATLLKHIFGLVQDGHVQVSLFAETSDVVSPSAPLVPVPASENVARLSETVSTMILQAFPNVSPGVVQQFVQGLFNLRGADLNLFKQHVRDFLIQLKEFSAENNKDLYKEENEALAEANRRAELEQRMAVPGLVNPNEDDL